MHSSSLDLDPHVCEAFDEACLAIFNTRVERPLRARAVGMSISTFPQALLQVILLQEKNFRRERQAIENK